MPKRLVRLIFASMLLLVAVPAFAAERVERLPEIAVATTARFNFALAIKLIDQPQTQVVGVYGSGSYLITQQEYRVSLRVVSAETPNQYLDVIAINDTVYVRPSNQTTWLRTTARDADVPVVDPLAPSVPTEGSVSISRLDTVQVNGVPTVQYQIWLDPRSLPGGVGDALIREGIIALTDDFFVAQNDSLLHKLQSNVLGTDPELGNFKFEFPFVFSGFGEPVSIEAPPASEVAAAVAANAVMEDVPGAAAYPAWVRPIIAHALASRR